MKITVCSYDKQDLELIIQTLLQRGIKCGEIQGRKKYWLFGAVTYYAVMDSIEFTYPPTTGGVNFAQGGIDAAKAGENMARLANELRNINWLDAKSELQCDLNEALDSEDFEQAAVIRDRIAELKQQQS